MITVELERELHDWLRRQEALDGVSVEDKALTLLRAARNAALEAKRHDERAR